MLGKLRLQDIRLHHIDDWVAKMDARGLSGRTIRIVAAPLRSALTEAVRWGKISFSPAQFVRFPKQARSEVRVLDREQVRAFRKAAQGTSYALFFDFMLSSGVRPGEGRALRWKDVDFEDGAAVICQAVSKDKGRVVIKQPKTKGSIRRIPLPRAILEDLRQHRVEQSQRTLKMGSVYDRSADLVFANEVGTPLCDRNLTQRYLKPLLVEAGLPKEITLYSLRHTHATLMLSEHIHIKVAAERLGHSTTRQTLDTYSHVLPGMQEEATRKIEALLYGSQ